MPSSLRHCLTALSCRCRTAAIGCHRRTIFKSPGPLPSPLGIAVPCTCLTIPLSGMVPGPWACRWGGGEGTAGPLACGMHGCHRHRAPLSSVHHLARSTSCSCAQHLGIAAQWRVVERVGIGSPGLWWRLCAIMGVGGGGTHGWAFSDRHHTLVHSARAFGPGVRWLWGCWWCPPTGGRGGGGMVLWPLVVAVHVVGHWAIGTVFLCATPGPLGPVDGGHGGAGGVLRLLLQSRTIEVVGGWSRVSVGNGAIGVMLLHATPGPFDPVDRGGEWV